MRMRKTGDAIFYNGFSRLKMVSLSRFLSHALSNSNPPAALQVLHAFGLRSAGRGRGRGSSSSSFRELPPQPAAADDVGSSFDGNDDDAPPSSL